MRASSKNVHALAMRCGFGAQEKTLQQHSRGVYTVRLSLTQLSADALGRDDGLLCN